MSNQKAQHFRTLVLSTPGRTTPRSKPTVALSDEKMMFVRLDADRLRWLVEDAGPRALEALNDG